MIEWLRAHPSDRVFLETAEGSHTYGEMAQRTAARPVEGVEVVRPRLDVESIVDLLALMSSGTAVIVGPGREPAAVPDPEGAACVMYTSGTTGVPKGVRLTAANWEAAALGSVQHLGHGPEDTWLLAMPLYHVAALAIILRSAYSGGKVRLLKAFEAGGYARELQVRATMASLVPTMLQRILAANPGAFRGLRAVLVGGGPIPDGLLERADGAGLPVLPTYGMTETCGQVATLRPGSPVEKKAHALPGVELTITKDGRLAVRGPQLSPGYVGEPDRGPDEWFVTGDLGEIDSDGAVRVTGRADNVIISGGENIDPVEVELALSGHPLLDRVMVVGVPSERWGYEVGCLYEGQVDPTRLEAWARDRLPAHKVPRHWRQVEEIPLSALGEPDRSSGRVILAA